MLGHQYIPLVALREGQISGVFPIAQVRNAFFGNSLISVPLAVYGGICANDSDSYFRLLQAGSELATRLDVNYLEMRNRSRAVSDLSAGKRPLSDFHARSFAGTGEAVAGVATGYALRRAEVAKGGLEWTEDLSDAEFYEIYAHSVHRLGTPVFPRKLFTRLREAFPGQVRVFGVRKGKEGHCRRDVLLFPGYSDAVLRRGASGIPEGLT